jgi:twitching motility protein PilT
MILLAGVTGSGKSTTIASMLNWINERERVHILTLEDPIEFVFTEDKALINQREVGIDVKDFKIGMKHAVREDPDIMLVGEMRDEGNVHDGHPRRRDGAPGVRHDPRFERPHDDRPYSGPVPRRDAQRDPQRDGLQHEGHHRPEAAQVDQARRPARADVRDHDLHPVIKKLILEAGRKLPDAIRIGAADGMQDFTMSLKQLIDDELIDRPTAFEVAPNPDALKMALKGINVSQPGII